MINLCFPQSKFSMGRTNKEQQKQLCETSCKKNITAKAITDTQDMKE